MKENTRKVLILIAMILTLVLNVNYVKAQEVNYDEDIIVDTDAGTVEVVSTDSPKFVAYANNEETQTKESSEEVTKAQTEVKTEKNEEQVTSAAPNAPATETKAEANDPEADETETDETSEPVITLHIMDNRNGSYEEYKSFEYAPGETANFQKLNMFTIFGLGSSTNAKTIKFTEGDYTYTFSGWYVDAANESQLTNTTGVPNESFGEVFSRFVLTTNVSYPNGLLLNVLSSITESKDIYIYANWVKTETPIIKVHIFDTFTGESVEQSSSPVIRTSGGSRSYYVYELLDRLTASSGQVITTDDYIYTFAGWYDEEGNKISEDGTVIGEVTLTHLSETNTRKNGLKIESTAPTSVQSVNVYAKWDVVAVPKGKVTIHLFDTITGENVDTGKVLVATTNKGTQSTTLNAVFSSLTNGPTRSYNGSKYKFLGWYDETGALISDEYTPTSVPSLKKLYSESSENYTSYRLYATAADDLYEDSEINVYAKWEIDQEPHNITIKYYSIKEGQVDELVKTVVRTIAPGTSETSLQTLDQIFDANDENRLYTGVKDSNSNTESDKHGRNVYTFLGWYDKNGVLIDENYTLSEEYKNAFKYIPAPVGTTIDERVAGENPYEISYVTQFGLDKDYTIEFYAHWSTYETPILHLIFVNNVSYDENITWTNPIGGTTLLDYELRTPSDGPAHYEFMYWVDEDGNSYENGHYIYDFSGKPSGFKETKTLYAVWQPSVTLNVYKDNSSTGDQNRISHDESTIEKGNKVTLLSPEEYGYKKTGYDFVGYYMMVDGEEVTVPIDTEFTAPEASYEKVAPLVYNVYAKWERSTETITVSKVWDDESNNAKNRPNSVTLELYATKENEELAEDAKPAYVVELDEDDGWSKELVIYPYDEEGNKLVYTIKESEHITSYDSEPNNETYTVTNTIMNDGTVIVKYIDKDTGLEIADSETITDSIEQPYETDEKVIDKYVFYAMAENSAARTGAITADPQTVIYLYDRIIGYIRVHHVDENGDYISHDKDYETCENGCAVEYRQTIEGRIGEEYNVQPLDIYGYENIAQDGTDFNGGDNENIGIFTKVGKFTKEGFDLFFVYKEAYGKVIVHYVDADTNKELEVVEVTGKVSDESYTTEIKSFENYTPVEEYEPETVTFTEEVQEKTYKYTKNNGLVIVHYVDKDTNEEIETVRITDKKIDEAYTTEQKEFTDYHYVDKSDNTRGTVAAEQTDVYYYYEKDNGTIIVHHIGIKDETEKELDSASLTGKIGSDYTTSPKEFEHYTLDQTRIPEPGKFVSGSINVYYYYTWNKGQVVVHYVADDQDEELETVTLDPANVDSKYETKAKEFTSYRLTGDSGNRNGVVTEGQTDVYYYYTRLESDVTVHYVDADTNEELDTEYGHGKVGETYTLINKDFENYTLVSGPEGETVTYTEEPIELTYTYKKNSGSITVYYKDLFTGKEIEGVEVKNTSGYVDQKYNAEPIDIEGYKFIRTEGNEELVGNYPNGENYVFTHYYQRVGKVIVHYYEIDSTTKVAEDVEQSGPINEIYMTTPAEEVEGYSLVETPANANGRYREELTEVIYYYQKLGKVITHYLDNNGNVLADSTESTGVVGEGYTTTPAEVEGYEVTGTPENATGEYTKEDINVTYIYTKVTEPETVYGNVHVKHITLDRTVLEENTITLEVGQTYETKELDTEEYELVSVSGDQTGIIEVGTKEVLYVYKEKEEEPSEPTTPETKEEGTVIAYYIDENGNSIADPMIIPGTYGTTYITYQKVIPGYTGTSIPENRIGKIEQELLELYYEYAKNEETPSEEPGSSCGGNCNCCNTCNTCNCNNGENQQPQIIININNENNSDNHSENNNDNNVNNEVNNDTNVENNTDINNENNTDVNNENNNQDETNVNIENNPVNNNESNASAETGDTNVTTGDVTTGDTNVTTGDTNVDNSTNVETGDNNLENNTTIENNPTNNVENNTDVDASSENNNENNSSSESNPNVENTNTSESNPNIDLDNSSSSESNPNVENNTTVENNPTNSNENNPTNNVDVDVNPTIGNENNPTNGNNNESNPTNNNENNPTNNNDGSNTNVNDNSNTDICDTCGEKEGEDEPSEPSQPDTPKVGRVIVKYVDEEGYTISPMVTIPGNVNDEYSTDKLRISGYEYDDVEGKTEGQIVEGTTYVTYKYKVAKPVQGKVIVHFRDEDGNTLASDQQYEGLVGESYTILEEYINGYELTKIEKVEQPTKMRLMLKRAVINEDLSKGNYTVEDTELVYIYTKVEEEPKEDDKQCCGTTVIVNCENNCPEVQPCEPSEPSEPEEPTPVEPSGEEPTVDPTDDPKVDPAEEPAKSDETKKGIVITNYVDINGNKISGKITYTGTVGKEYNTLKKEIDGYEFVRVDGQASGTYIDGTLVVTYVYENLNGTGSTDSEIKDGEVKGETKEVLPPKTKIDSLQYINILWMIIPAFIISRKKTIEQ